MQRPPIKAPAPEIPRFTFCRFRKRKCKPQYFRSGGPNQKSPHQIPRTPSKEHTRQVPDHSPEPALQEVAQKLKKQSRDKAVQSSGLPHNRMQTPTPEAGHPEKGKSDQPPVLRIPFVPSSSTAHLKTRTWHFPPLDPPPPPVLIN